MFVTLVQRAVEMAARLADRHHFWMILVHRFPYGIRGVAGIAYGMSSISWPLFLVMNFVGAGLWHPEPDTQRRVRQFILDNPGSWKKAAHDPAFRRRFEFEESEKLVRPPRGFPADHPLIEDIKRKDFTAGEALEDEVQASPEKFTPWLRIYLAEGMAEAAV